MGLRLPGIALLPVLLIGAGCVTPRQNAPSPVLPAPESAEEKAYLGLAEDAQTFAMQEVRAELIVVEIFDAYCHLCQKAAPGANALYERIENGKHADRVKMIAVGTGNTALEANLFKERFSVPFPVLADRDAAVSRAIGHTRTPEFVLLRREEETGGLDEVGRRVSYFTDAGEVYDWMLRKAGL